MWRHIRLCECDALLSMQSLRLDNDISVDLLATIAVLRVLRTTRVVKCKARIGLLLQNVDRIVVSGWRIVGGLIATMVNLQNAFYNQWKRIKLI